MKIKFLVAIAVTFIIITIGSCSYDKYNKLYPAPVVSVCDTANMSFKDDIQPILNANCVVCHSASGVAAAYGDYTTYAGRPGITNYTIPPYKLISDITNTDVSSINHMPQNTSSLPQCEIDKITAWVNQQGAQNN